METIIKKSKNGNMVIKTILSDNESAVYTAELKVLLETGCINTEDDLVSWLKTVRKIDPHFIDLGENNEN